MTRRGEAAAPRRGRRVACLGSDPARVLGASRLSGARVDLAQAPRRRRSSPSPIYHGACESALPRVRGQSRRAHYRLLVQLTERLERSERPVSARGMILAERIFGDGAGPLLDRERADELGPAFAEALRALDADSEP